MNENTGQHQRRINLWRIAGAVALSIPVTLIAYNATVKVYDDYTLDQARKRIDKLPASYVAERVKSLQQGTAYSVKREKEPLFRYPSGYESISYSPSPTEGIVFSDFIQGLTRLQGVSYADRNGDGNIDVRIDFRRGISGSNDRGVCFENLPECNEVALQDHISQKTRLSEEFKTAQARYEAGLRKFLKERTYR
ncbi:MAG: hypothetical protein AABX13_02475 [Nanoarchaeota archaeon]